jgi:hypothetical protein
VARLRPSTLPGKRCIVSLTHALSRPSHSKAGRTETLKTYQPNIVRQATVPWNEAGSLQRWCTCDPTATRVTICAHRTGASYAHTAACQQKSRVSERLAVEVLGRSRPRVPLFCL